MARRRQCRNCGTPEVVKNGCSNLSPYGCVCVGCVNATLKRADHLEARAIERVLKANVRAPLSAIRNFVAAAGAKTVLSASLAEIQRANAFF